MKKVALVFLLLFSTYFLFAQGSSVSDLKPFDKKRFYVGGNGGLSFGSVTYIEVSPLLGYRATDRLSVGIQPSFTYIKYKLYDYYGNYTGKKEESFYYGGGVYTRFYVLDNVFAHAQYEMNNFEVLEPNNPIYPTAFEKKRITIPSLLLGAGYSQRVGENSACTISVLYDVIQNVYSPYYNRPVIRAGFGIGL